MDQLRLETGYGCSTPYEAIQMNKYMKRGQLLETIIVEEFSEEFDVEWGE